MKKVLIIPDMKRINDSLALASEYDLGFEYNDFFLPDVLDDRSRQNEIVNFYKNISVPDYCTIHGAFFDVTISSPDRRIREISALRINQSLEAARNIGARGVVFHTNYNPFLNSDTYIKSWTEQNAEFWSRVLSDNNDIEIYLENMFDTTPRVMKALAEKLCSAPNFGICLDYAHLSLTKVSAEEWMSSLGPYVRHMHINDNDLVSDLHLAVGSGRIDWNEFYALFRKYISGSVTMLVETSSVESQRASLEKLRKDNFI